MVHGRLDMAVDRLSISAAIAIAPELGGAVKLSSPRKELAAFDKSPKSP